MYVYVCGEENNLLNCCSIIYFVSRDRLIYVCYKASKTAEEKQLRFPVDDNCPHG